jgi:PAS domain S-box-containing protein
MIDDITERKQAEETLRESEKRLNRTQEITHLGSWELDVVNDRLIWSDEVYRIFGLKPQEFGATYEAFLDRVHPDDRAAVDAAYTDSLRANRDTYEVEHRVIRKDSGEVRFVHEKCEHSRDTTGRIIRSIGMVLDITESKQAQEALRESESKVRALLYSTGQPIYGMDLSRKCTFVNPAFLRMLGYRDQDELLGKNMHALIHHTRADGQPYPEEECLVCEAFGREEGIHVDDEVLWRADNTSLSAEYWSHPIHENGRLVGAVVAFIDITERKRNERSLRVRNRAMEAAGNGVMLTDLTQPDNPLIYCNPAFEKITGYTADEVLGRNARFLQGDDREQEGLKEVRAAIEQGRECHVVLRNYRKDGTLFWNELTIAPVRDINGEVTNFVGIQNDITQRKQAEETLREREQQFGLILASTGEGIFGMDLEGKFTFANRACVELLGYEDEKDLIGQDMHALIHHTRSDGTPYRKKDCPMFQARSPGKVVHLDDEVLWRADGTSFPVECRAYAMLRGAETVGTVVSFVDITERKDKEAQLLQAQKMEVVGQLTGGIAHDFNNLLTVILANLGLLRDEIASDLVPSRREMINDAVSAARDGAALTHRLLAFSRKEPLQVTRVDIDAFLRNIRRFLQRTLREDIELRINRANEPPPVLVDPSQLENALLNLVLNARDAMPTGGTLSIETTRKYIGADEAAADPELAPGNYVMITVSDSGIGMSPEDAARAIEPFFTTKPHGKGSGLGLSMVYGFAKQSGGALQLRSVLGEGTSVAMLLPEAAQAIDEDDAELTQQHAPGGSETILLVEDELRLRNVAKHILLGLGYQVIEAENAAAATKAFEAAAAVDLLFTDIVMPGDTSGYELARWASQKSPGLKVLLATGFSEEVTGKLSADIGPVHLLRKPYAKTELAAAVRAVLDGGAVRSPA